MSVNRFKKEFKENKCGEGVLCYYCGCSAKDIKSFCAIEYITKKDKKKNAFRYRTKDGAIVRGVNLEIERKQPHEDYTDDNCKPACYICNNAKSNFLFEPERFREIIGTAIRTLVKETLDRHNILHNIK